MLLLHLLNYYSIPLTLNVLFIFLLIVMLNLIFLKLIILKFSFLFLKQPYHSSFFELFQVIFIFKLHPNFI